MSTAQVDHRERQARTAGEEARRRILELSEERARAYLDQIGNVAGADDEAERLDAEIAELEKRAKLADDAAAEAAKQAEEKRIRDEERARDEARREYDELVAERVPLLENVEEAFDQLDHAISAVQVLDGQHVDAATRAGLPGGGDFRSLVGGRVASRLVSWTGGRYISHPIYELQLTESDRMCMTVSELEEEQEAEQLLREEQAAERRLQEERAELSDKISRRRNELIKAYGGWGAEAGPGKYQAARAKADEQLTKEFPILKGA